MPRLDNSCEGTDAALVTVGNSANPDAWGAVTDPNSVLTYSTTQIKRGLTSMALASPAVYAATHAGWISLAIAGDVDVWTRQYVFVPAISTSAMPIMSMLTAAGTTTCRGRFNGTTGRVTFTNGAGTEIAAATGTVAVATGQWVRVEFRVRANATTGEVEWRLFNDPDSTTATETGGATGQALGADINTVRFGFTGTSGPVSTTWFFDDLAMDTAGWIGPATVVDDTTKLAIPGMFSHHLAEEMWF